MNRLDAIDIFFTVLLVAMVVSIVYCGVMLVNDIANDRACRALGYIDSVSYGDNVFCRKINKDHLMVYYNIQDIVP